MKTRIITSLAAGLMSVGMMLAGGSPASAGNGKDGTASHRDSGHSQHADSPTFILNNNSSLLSGNNVLSNLQVIVDLLGFIGAANNGNHDGGGHEGGSHH